MKVIQGLILAVLLASQPIFSAEKNKDDNKVQPKASISSASSLKDILYRLVKQDEYLDETIEKLRSSHGKLNETDSAEISSRIKLIKNSLNEVASLNKNQLALVTPDSETAKYTRTIMVYSQKISRKTRSMVSSLDKASAASSMRNAPVSSKRQVKGKKLSQILREKEAADNLKKEFASLEKAAGRVKASSKWLYIASK